MIKSIPSRRSFGFVQNLAIILFATSASATSIAVTVNDLEIPIAPSASPMAMAENEKLAMFEDDYHDFYYKYPESLRDYDWVISQQGYLPRDAVIGGYQDDCILYICKVYYMENIIPGKVVDGYCHVTYDGREIVMKENYKVLTGQGFKWAFAKNGDVPPRAVEGGMDQNGNPFYICRAFYAGGKRPGKISGTACHFSYKGNELWRKRYEVLTNRDI